MQKKNYWKQISLFACVYYTAATFLILFLYFAFNANLSNGMSPLALISILPFAFLFSAANTLYRESKIKKVYRVLLHYFFSVGGAMLFLYLPNKAPEQKPTAALLLFFALSLIYTAIMGTVLGVSARIKRVQRDNSAYQRVYKKK